MLRRIDLAYIAGFFDGEGSVYIRRGKRTGMVSEAFWLTAKMENMDRGVLDYIQGFFGGCISVQSRNSTGTVWRLAIVANQAYRFLLAVLPYLRIKRKHAEIGILFQRDMKPGFKHISDEELQRRVTLRRQLKRLNRNNQRLKRYVGEEFGSDSLYEVCT